MVVKAPIKRNPYLTPAMEKVLRWMSKVGGDGSDEDGELVVEGGEAWYGLNRTSMRVVNSLLRLCLIRDNTKDGAMTETSYRYYTINEEGRKILVDVAYKPKILEAISKASKRR